MMTVTCVIAAQSLPHAYFVPLAWYSIVLNKVMVISNGQIELSLFGYPDGVYTLNIRTGDRVDVFKLIKL